MKKKVFDIILVFSIILVVFVSGCAQETEKPAGTTEEKPTCQEYCEKQPHIMCVGQREISGEYPDCECKFLCETVEAEIGAETGKEEAVGEIPVVDTLKKIFDVPRVNSAAHIKLFEEGVLIEEEDTPSLCYLGALTMLIIYDNKSLDFADVVAYSGIGSAAAIDEMTGLSNNFKEESIIHAAKNLGYNYNLGVKAGGKANSFKANFEKSATEINFFMSPEEAFTFLRTRIGLGKPVLVHLDIYYVIDDFRKSSRFWVTGWEKVHASHFMAVTGYDDSNVYINDPTDPDLSIKNMEVPQSSFMKAWENGANTNIKGARLGPYWMIYLNKQYKSKSVEDIVAWNREISVSSATRIRSAGGEGDYGELGVGRMGFSRFLKRNGYGEAGNLYEEAAMMYLTEPDPDMLKDIADKEDKARDLLK